MAPEPIRELLLAQPFRPFTLLMATGWRRTIGSSFCVRPELERQFSSIAPGRCTSLTWLWSPSLSPMVRL
jgi:hypothetical protein